MLIPILTLPACSRELQQSWDCHLKRKFQSTNTPIKLVVGGRVITKKTSGTPRASAFTVEGSNFETPGEATSLIGRFALFGILCLFFLYELNNAQVIKESQSLTHDEILGFNCLSTDNVRRRSPVRWCILHYLFKHITVFKKQVNASMLVLI